MGMIKFKTEAIKNKYLYCLFLLLILNGCESKPGEDYTSSDLSPKIEPDYSDITIPPNIAPLNFIIKEEGSGFKAEVTSSDGYIISIKSKGKAPFRI